MNSINDKDLNVIEERLQNSIEQDRRYWVTNAVKCDAVHTAKSYEEFSERVAAAHLRPLERGDAFGRRHESTLWNNFVRQRKRQN